MMSLSKAGSQQWILRPCWWQVHSQMTSHDTPPSEVQTLIPLTIFCSATSSLITSSTLCSWNPTYCPSLSLISRAHLQFLSTPVPESIQPVQNNPLQVHPLPRQLSLPYIFPNGIQFRDRLPGLRLATVWKSKCQIGFLQFIILLFSLLWTTLSMKEVYGWLTLLLGFINSLHLIDNKHQI